MHLYRISTDPNNMSLFSSYLVYANDSSQALEVFSNKFKHHGRSCIAGIEYVDSSVVALEC